MANTVRSRKAKGRIHQKETAYQIRTTFNLEERDVVSSPASVTGEDIILSEKAKQLFPYSVECKCQEKLNIWQAIEQAEENSKDGRTPIVVFRRNRSKTYAVIEFEKLLEKIK